MLSQGVPHSQQMNRIAIMESWSQRNGVFLAKLHTQHTTTVQCGQKLVEALLIWSLRQSLACNVVDMALDGLMHLPAAMAITYEAIYQAGKKVMN